MEVDVLTEEVPAGDEGAGLSACADWRRERQRDNGGFNDIAGQLGMHPEFGVEPICKTLQVAPSTYYAAKTRPLSKRAVEDARLVSEVERVWEANYRVYGRRKIWAQLNREGIPIGRDRAERLMRQAGIAGMTRGRKVRTTRPDPIADWFGDVDRLSRRERRTWSTATGPWLAPTACGSATSPTSPPGRAWRMSRS